MDIFYTKFQNLDTDKQYAIKYRGRGDTPEECTEWVELPEVFSPGILDYTTTDLIEAYSESCHCPHGCKEDIVKNSVVLKLNKLAQYHEVVISAV